MTTIHRLNIKKPPEYLGADCFIYVECKGLGVITVRVGDEVAYKTGQKVGLSFDRNRLHFFDENEQACR